MADVSPEDVKGIYFHNCLHTMLKNMKLAGQCKLQSMQYSTRIEFNESLLVVMKEDKLW